MKLLKTLLITVSTFGIFKLFKKNDWPTKNELEKNFKNDFFDRVVNIVSDSQFANYNNIYNAENLAQWLIENADNLEDNNGQYPFVLKIQQIVIGTFDPNKPPLVKETILQYNNQKPYVTNPSGSTSIIQKVVLINGKNIYFVIRYQPYYPL